MKRTLEDIRENLDFVGCDNETARELCDEIERLHELWMSEQRARLAQNELLEVYSAAKAKFEIERMTRSEHHLRGCVNVLADKLAQYTGKTVPAEITGAESVLAQLTECRRLLREACDYLRDAACNDAIVARWAQRAREASR